ncbi:outer membrane receptor protein [Aequorivita sublithincola DSM 14238]|uniref:Outer membrane receptor protein n=1 Tax=Aequorivita sublithincola (strain DSM 14238 / LMG 21431 / ACAM 643 / 9-3) TaxID=746697 RepID=I3YVG9_AEQSU|nr:carboxypeptidase-like regulatory domain-containing protein [Aequorivita sublithincola]AFL80987.1 outer membrane receptor protein [Aequorivita sublithincola DSM 14238]
MKKLLLLVFLLGGFAAFSQTIVTGTVVDSESNDPLAGANVVETGTTNGAITDFDGNFTLKTSAKAGMLTISYIGYAIQKVPFKVTGASLNLGTVKITVDDDALEEVVIVGRGIIDLAKDRQTPIAVSTITSAEIQAKAIGNVEFPEAIKSTPSVYVANQAGGFGDSEMFLRGFDQTNTAFLLNGQPINGMEDGRMYWSNWSGMSDVANAVQVQRGLGSSKLAISSVGGTVNIVSRAAGRKEGGFARFMTGNDSYFKGTISYDSGLKGKWAYSFLLDHWQAHRKYSDGTGGQGQNYFVGIGYIPNDKHSFNFLLTGAPQYHDQNFTNSLKTYAERGKRFNANSGFYNGERFTLRRNYYHKPVVNLNWDWNISEKTNLSSVLYASFGRGGGTGPAGKSSSIATDENGEVDFDKIEENNIAGAENGIGSFGQGSLVRRMSVNNHNWYGFLTNLESNVSDNFTVNVGLDTRFYKGSHWYQMNNLLGLQGYADGRGYGDARDDSYVISETFEANPWAALFSSADEAQRFNYDYSENINYIGGFGQAEYKVDNFSAFVQGAVSTQSYQREGRAEGKEIEGVNGLGKSEKINKMGYNVKGGMGYSFLENSTIFANGGYYSRQPFLDNIFDDVRNSNYILSGDDEIENEEILGLEVGYRLRAGAFSLDLNGYYTSWGNRFLGGSFIKGDPNSTNPIEQVDRFQRFTNITQLHKGFEFEGKYRYSGDFMLRAFGSIGNWKYDGSTPFQTRDNETNVVLEEGNIDLSGTKVGNAPQTSFGFGFKYNIVGGLSVDSDYNVYTDLYGFVDAKDVIKASQKGEVYQAQRLPAYGVLDAGITYKFDFGGNDLTFRANCYNATNEIYLSQKSSRGEFYYGNGRTWNASIRYNF